MNPAIKPLTPPLVTPARRFAAWSALLPSLLIAAHLALPAQAQGQPTGTPGTPSAHDMIQQLKAAPAPAEAGGTANAPRTRGLSRNLQVKAVDDSGAVIPPAGTPGASAPRPSLSLLIQFDFDSARVRPESQVALNNLASALQSPELLASRFAVEGHTDAKGRAEHNQRLSQQRAEAVRDYLVHRGIATDRLQPSGKGSTELANAADPTAAENRRVRIVNLD